MLSFFLHCTKFVRIYKLRLLFVHCFFRNTFYSSIRNTLLSILGSNHESLTKSITSSFVNVRFFSSILDIKLITFLCSIVYGSCPLTLACHLADGDYVCLLVTLTCCCFREWCCGWWCFSQIHHVACSEVWLL